MTRKRRSSLSPDQLGFTFDAPSLATAPASLAGLERMFAAAVAQALREDERDRHAIAAEVSRLLADEVTKSMLDAYASEARDNHNVSGARFFAIIAATDRHDLLDALVRQIGAALLIGEEIHTARLGHLDRQIAALTAERKRVAAQATPIERRGAK